MGLLRLWKKQLNTNIIKIVNSPPSSPTNPKPKTTPNRKRWLSIFLVFVAIVGASGSYYFYKKYEAIKTNPNAAAQKEVEELVATVGKLMELPEGETPTVATISDKSKLTDQAFFKTAANDDKLFVYNAAMLAILYRPSINKIINVAPISINEAQDTTSANTNSAPDVLRIAYYNGTKTVGLSQLAEASVKEQYPNWQTAAITNAEKNDYTTTIVVDLGGHSQEASDLASLLDGAVAPIPSGEARPDADILIISGK